MRGKFAIRLTDTIVGIVQINLDVPDKVRQAAAMHGYGPQEMENIIGQEFQRILDILALDEEAL